MRAVLVSLALCLSLAIGDTQTSDTDAGSKHGLDEIDFHSAGVETTSEQDTDQSSANSTQQISHGTSGLAWDKHDFEVTNNKGGDVKVEVNLAAPMTSEGGPEEDDGADISDMLRLLAPEDPVNPLELMGMMKDLMMTMKPDEPEFNITDILNQFKSSIPPPQPPPPQQDLGPLISALTDAIKETRSEAVQPQPPPMPNPETIIRALQPPPIIMPPPSAPAFDPSSFMRELREALAANKPPPVPPPGVDPGLLDAIRDTLKEIKELRQRPEPTPPPPPPIPPQPPATPPPQPSPVQEPPSYYPPPPPPPTGGNPPGNSPAELKDLLQSMMEKMAPAPLPAFPTAAQDAALEELRAMIRAQQAQASKPIILPPPIAHTPDLDSHVIIAPPPPPPPSSSTEFKDKLQEMIKGMIPAPQRIPAPPRITLKTETVSCCAVPSPEDPRPEEVRCPRINGVRPPRCRRDQPPSVYPMKCTRGNCGAVDDDGDINIEGVTGNTPKQIAASSFNPQKLLRALCPGGLCPEQKDLDPRMNPRLAPEAAQTGSF